MSPSLDKFTQAYIGAALWSSMDENGEPLDRNYDATDIAEATLETMRADCQQFQQTHVDLLTQAYDLYSHNPEWSHEEQAGHDFWLTRNGHGVGFWDRGLGDIGQKLTEASHLFGEVDLYVGDDGRIYQ